MVEETATFQGFYSFAPLTTLPPQNVTGCRLAVKLISHTHVNLDDSEVQLREFLARCLDVDDSHNVYSKLLTLGPEPLTLAGLVAAVHAFLKDPACPLSTGDFALSYRQSLECLSGWESPEPRPQFADLNALMDWVQNAELHTSTFWGILRLLSLRWYLCTTRSGEAGLCLLEVAYRGGSLVRFLYFHLVHNDLRHVYENWQLPLTAPAESGALTEEIAARQPELLRVWLPVFGPLTLLPPPPPVASSSSTTGDSSSSSASSA